MIDKIISGGQTWPEIAALDMAIKLGIPYSGWLPGIQVPDQSLRTDKYRLHTLSSNRPGDAIEKNVKAADGTFIISYGRLQGIADVARQSTLKNRKHLLGIDLGQHTAFAATGLLTSWLEMNHIRSLYVTGSTKEGKSRIYHHTSNILESGIMASLARSTLPDHTGITSGHGTGIVARQATTVTEAVEILISMISLKEKTTIASSQLDVFLQPGHPFGPYIQSVFKLQTGNAVLMKSCTALSGKASITPSEASHVIIKALWKHLQQTHRLRIIK